MTTLYFMRHAQSEANSQDILASQKDFALTDKGHKDARAIAQQFLLRHSIDVIIASPLLRAQQTATPFANQLGQEIKNDPRIIEQHLGKYSGMSYQQLENEADYCHERSERWLWLPEGGGESYQMIAERLAPFFIEVSQQNPEGNVLVITHAVTMRMIRASLENTLPQYPEEIADNGEVWQVEYQGFGHRHQIKSLRYGDVGTLQHRA